MTMAEALVRFLGAQEIETAGKTVPLFAAVFAIFGHGNVAGLGPALHAARRRLPTLRAHNEQAMAHAATAFAKAHARRRIMACTTSIGPGASNMVTAAAVAHVNRLPVLLLPGDIFASRRPDPVLQQLEAFGDPTVSVNDCFRPVSRFFDRVMRPEQILSSLPAALRVLLDPAECGPVTLALPQDVQTEAFDYPSDFLRRRVHRIRRALPDQKELAATVAALRKAKKPLLIAGGGVKYALAEGRLAAFAEAHGLPVAETQAGKGSLAWDHSANVGAIGVTGAASANQLAARADLVLAIGTRLADFATGSRALFAQAKLVQLNVAAFDAAKHGSLALVADADAGLEALDEALRGWRAPAAWTTAAQRAMRAWNLKVDEIVKPSKGKPTDAQVLGAVHQVISAKPNILVCAAGGLPGELHKLWRAADATSYHLEYGYSCMGYEIAGGLGAKLAHPEREVCVLVGDGSYLMLNSEIATSVALGAKLIIVVLDNGGFGCIERLQAATGGASFNNLLDGPRIDFVAHARSLGAQADFARDLSALKTGLTRALRAGRTSVIVIETDPRRGTAEGGAWWDVAVSATPRSPAQKRARSAYERARRSQRLGS